MTLIPRHADGCRYPCSLTCGRVLSGWNPDNGYREGVAERTKKCCMMAQLSALTR